MKPLCHLDDLPEQIGVPVLIQDSSGTTEQAALFKLSNETVYAISNFDPFSSTNTLSRGITGEIQGQKVVAAPMYKQHFNLETGQCLEDDLVSIKIYNVEINDGFIYIHT